MEAEAVKGKQMTKCCPSSVCTFSLLMCPHPWITHVPTTLFITSSHTLPLCVIPGSSHRGGGVFVPVPLQAVLPVPLGGPRKTALQGDSHPQSRYKVRNPVRPPHAASSNHPSRQLPAACVAFVTSPGLPCPFPCHITACV